MKSGIVRIHLRDGTRLDGELLQPDGVPFQRHNFAGELGACADLHYTLGFVEQCTAIFQPIDADQIVFVGEVYYEVTP